MATTGSLKQLSGSGTLGHTKHRGSTTGGLGSDGHGTGFDDISSIQRFEGMAELLAPPHSLEDLDLKQNMVTDIMLRLTSNEGEVSVSRAEDVIKLPFRVTMLNVPCGAVVISQEPLQPKPSKTRPTSIVWCSIN